MPRLQVRLLTLAFLLLAFPFFLRRRPRVERRVTICAPPEAIFPLINDLRNWPLWTAWSEREEMDFFYGDTVAGVGAVQRWRSRKRDGMVRLVRSDENARVDYDATLNDGRFRLLGRLELRRDGSCTRVTWRCVWEPSSNPYRRYLDLFGRWMIGRDFARGLERLKTRVERIQPVAAPGA